MKKRRNIYVDMDGTLFGWKKATGKELMSRSFYEGLSPFPQMGEFLNELKETRKDVGLFILSHCVNEDAGLGKGHALDSDPVLSGLFPEGSRIFVPCGKSKALEVLMRTGRKHLTAGDILLDDHTANCADWEARGGRAIKVLNGINGTGGKWKGERMDLSGHLISRPMLPPGAPGIPDECAEELVYRIYLTAVDDIRQGNPYSRQALSFLRRDPYGIMTERIMGALKEKGYAAI